MTLTKTQLSALSYLARFPDGRWVNLNVYARKVLKQIRYPGLYEERQDERRQRQARITAAGRQALARATGADKVRRGETAAQYASRNCATIAAIVRWAEGKGE